MLHTTPLLPTIGGRRRRRRSPGPPRVLHRARRRPDRDRLGRVAPRGRRAGCVGRRGRGRTERDGRARRVRWRSVCRRRSARGRSTPTRPSAMPRSTYATASGTDASSAASTDAASTLHVRELLRDLPVADAQHVDAAQRTRRCRRRWSTCTATARCSGRRRRSRLRRRSARRVTPRRTPPTRRAPAAWPSYRSAVRRRRVLEHAVVGHRGHHRVDVVTIERVVEPVDRRDRGVGQVIGPSSRSVVVTSSVGSSFAATNTSSGPRCRLENDRDPERRSRGESLQPTSRTDQTVFVGSRAKSPSSITKRRTDAPRS